jgi:uncharacterized GH25 family protein
MEPMNVTMNLKNATRIGLALCLAHSLLAHDLFVMPKTFRPKTGDNLIVALHHGDKFPESEGVAPIARLGDVKLVSAGGSVDLKGFKEEGKTLIMTQPVAADMKGSFVITGILNANKRDHDPKEFATYIGEEHLTMIDEYRKVHSETDKSGTELYSKYGKALLVNGSPSGFDTKPVGLKLEFVPAADPATLKPGASLPVQVLLEGKPAPGLTVESVCSTGAPAEAVVAGVTNGKGELAVSLKEGTCRLTTAFSRRNADQAASNWETFFATLTFQTGR